MFGKPTVRVRLAPSPTGEVHIGTIWTALFNWLHAKQQAGRFILRIEDTDQQRLVPGSVERILEALAWYGIEPDEGPKQGGRFGPYVQSQRQELYQRYANSLIENGSAYYCFCTTERLTELRQQLQAAKQPPRYDKHCAKLSSEEATKRREAGESTVIRLKLPRSGTIEHHDVIRGTVTFSLDQLDDSVILKSDGFPTYHLAVVVDDHLMEITHVIRAEEWLPSVPKHLFLYQALGWEPPTFAHLPLILGSDGSKLSKRHGAASALWFRDNGYLPETMTNFLGLMGWHPKGDRETLSRDELLKEFSLEAVNSSGAKFDQRKLDWLNGWYIRQLQIDELYERVKPFWSFLDDLEKKVATGILLLIQDRLVTLKEVDELTNTLVAAGWDKEHQTFDTKLLVPKKGDRDTTKARVDWAISWLSEFQGPWLAAELKSQLLEAIKQAGYSNLEVLWPVRVGLTLRSASPDVFDLLALLGKPEALRRLKAINRA